MLVPFVADHGFGVSDHIVVDIEMVPHEVNCEDDADQQRNPAFQGPCVEVHPLQNHGSSHVDDRKLMDFMQHGVELHVVADEVLAFLLEVPPQGPHQPHEDNQRNGNVNIVDEEAGHARALVTPGQALQAEQSALVEGQVVKLVSHKVIRPAAAALPGRHVVEGGNAEEATRFVEVLRGDTVHQNRRGGYVSPREQHRKDSRFLYLSQHRRSSGVSVDVVDAA